MDDKQVKIKAQSKPTVVSVENHGLTGAVSNQSVAASMISFEIIEDDLSIYYNNEKSIILGFSDDNILVNGAVQLDANEEIISKVIQELIASQDQDEFHVILHGDQKSSMYLFIKIANILRDIGIKRFSIAELR